MRSMTASPQKGANRRAWQRAIVASVVALVTTLATLAATMSVAAESPAPLPVDAAFATEAALLPGKIVVKFDVVPGHYLYRDRFEVQANGQVISVIGLPKGKLKVDPHFGRVEVYETPFVLSVATKLTHDTELKLVFQGCSEVAGVCYPPTTRTFALVAGARDVRAKERVPVSLKQQFKPQVSQ
jgi:thiol:disulfide interchange protein